MYASASFSPSISKTFKEFSRSTWMRIGSSLIPSLGVSSSPIYELQIEITIFISPLCAGESNLDFFLTLVNDRCEEKKKGSPLRHPDMSGLNNATSRGLRRISPRQEPGDPSRGIDLA
jgi:hypothetical protein